MREKSEGGKQRKHKVLMIEAAPGFGGSTVALVHLLKGLDKSKFDLTVLVSHPDAMEYIKRKGGDFQTLIYFDVIGWAKSRPCERWPRKVFSCLGKVGQRLVSGIIVAFNLSFPMWIRAFKILKIIKQRGADVVVINNGIQLTVPAIVAVKLASLPCITIVRGPARVNFIYKVIAKLVDLYVPVSHATAETIKALGVPEGRIVVAHDGVELSFFASKDKAAARQALGLPLDKPIFGIVGLLTPRKAQDIFLKAAKLVFEKFPDSLALIVGDPLEETLAYKDELFRLCEELGIKDKVKFMPHTDDTPTVYAALDVSVMCSKSEACPLVVLEAMAMARPVVATKAGGAVELVVDGETGYLVEIGDAEGLAEAIKKLLSDPELAERMGKAGRARVEENFTVQKQVQKVESILLQMLEGNIRAQ